MRRWQPRTFPSPSGKAVFWLTFLVFMPSILGSLGIGETATPIQSMVDQLLGIIPGIIGAVIILVLGTLLARIVRQIVTGFLEGVGVDRLGERVGLSRERTRSRCRLCWEPWSTSSSSFRSSCRR
jgi:hypothetical protein